MHYKFGEALLRYRETDPQYSETKEKAVVVVETRPNIWFPLVVKNIIDKLPGWKIYIVGSQCSIEYLNSVVKQKLNYILLPKNFLRVEEYNKMLFSTQFWELFSEEHILIAQPDCLILREPLDRHFSFPFIGAVCFSTQEDSFIMNGGLSLRKRSIMLQICKDMMNGSETGPEDVVFTNIIRKNRMGLPSMKECNSFAIESFGDPTTAVGVHGTDKNYLNSLQIDKILSAELFTS